MVILVCLLYILLVLAFFVNVFIADRNMHANLMMRNGRHGVHGGGGGIPPPAGMHPGHHNPYDMHGYNHYSNYHPQVDSKQQQELAKKTPQQQAEQDIYYYFNHVFRRRRR